jgi:hypothetical protein
VSRIAKILLKKSARQSTVKFCSKPQFLLGILIHGTASRDSILSTQRNKVRRADFFNRIANNPALHVPRLNDQKPTFVHTTLMEVIGRSRTLTSAPTEP